MKKLTLFLCVLSLTLLCGCTGYRETERGYLVTAIGFKKSSGKIGISLETLVASDTEQNNESENILYGEGKDIVSAYSDIKRQLLKDIYFEHCGVIAVENGFDDNETTEILNFCRGLQSLNIGVYVVKTDDINALFETKVSHESVGYAVIGLIKNAGDSDFSNKLYEIQKNQTAFTLPQIKKKDNTLFLE